MIPDFDDALALNVGSVDHFRANTPSIGDSNNDCNLNHLYQCSAKAKMTNKPYYGIEGGTDKDGQTICNCYIFDERATAHQSAREFFKNCPAQKK